MPGFMWLIKLASMVPLCTPSAKSHEMTGPLPPLKRSPMAIVKRPFAPLDQARLTGAVRLKVPQLVVPETASKVQTGEVMMTSSAL